VRTGEEYIEREDYVDAQMKIAKVLLTPFDPVGGHAHSTARWALAR
jgi:hypothetical protein